MGVLCIFHARGISRSGGAAKVEKGMALVRWDLVQTTIESQTEQTDLRVPAL